MSPSPAVVKCAVITVVVSGFVAACDESRPIGLGPPSGPSGPAVVRVEIVGPATIAPGESAQYSAVQFLSDGSSGPATQVSWSSSQPSLLQVNANGLATAQPPFRGDVILQVDLSAASVPNGVRRASREIVVLPDGTFRLVGTVTEADTSNVPVGGARVEAAADANLSTPAETFATTGPDGRYKLYGVPADAHLRVVKDGYVTAVESIQLARHETRNVQLRLERPRLELAGEYTMTIETASRFCTLPDDLRRRTYEAVIAQNGPQLTVTLTAPQFLLDPSGRGNQFSGRITASGAEFEMRNFADFYYYPNNPQHPDVAELLPDETVLVVVGTPRVTGTSAGLSGQVNGWLNLYRGSRFPSVSWLSGCGATGLTLTPR